MTSKNEMISGKVDLALLDKVDRLFRNDDAGIWIELLQNARRAAATRIDITIQETQADASCLVTVQDDGGGIEDFHQLLTLGASDWPAATKRFEDPAGMGFFSLCRSEVEVHSGHRFAKITPSVFLGKSSAEIKISGECVRGTRLRFTRTSSRFALRESLERVTKFYPLEVRLEGDVLLRRDFLDSALYREVIDGIEVGFSTDPHWGQSYLPNWNFYGSCLREPFDSFTGLLTGEADSFPATIYARFNVLKTARVKLQLPDRRAIIQDEAFRDFLSKARAAAYRFFQAQSQHALPFKNWREAKDLGINLPEAAPLLTTWHASPLDDNVAPLFGDSERHRLTDTSLVLLVDPALPNAHTLEGALHSGAEIDGTLYEWDRNFEGYAWYDRLPRIAGATVLLDDVPLPESFEPSNTRPEQIDLELTIEQQGQSEQKLRIPALIHVSLNYELDLRFVAVRNSPWDNSLNGPFSVGPFLIWATFLASDDSDADSWNTQMDDYEESVERRVHAYFLGPKATLLTILSRAIGWQESQLATALGVQEIRFRRRNPDQATWEIELVE